jgi:predicted DNA-binding transcriptional regulator AlpA
VSEDRILCTDKEAAEMLAMGRSTFWKKVGDRLLPGPVKIGGLTRWRVSDLRRHLEAMQTTTPSTPDAA